MEGAEESMSNEVDKRIVEMQFKNEEFEKNAAKTLQTLQELKQKLNDNFSTKGPEKLNEAIKAVDVSPISQGLETVQLKFNALQIAGKRIIENITDAAMNAIHKVTSLIQAPLNQIKEGGARRAQNIEQAKFMLSGLGIEWKDIVDDINYGVQDTAYGLDAAAKVASQLVASNVALGKDMQASLRGVSGVAAMTNSTYEEIGHIFTSVAGQGKLMSMQLQQFSLRGLNVAADLAKSMNTTEAAIRDMVSKGQIDFMTFAKAMDELYGGHAKEANNTFTGALSNTKAALSRLGADIQSQKFESFRIILLEVTTQLKELKKAFKPAEDAIISMMDAVGKLVTNFIKSINIKAIVEKITPSIKKVADYVRDFADAWRMLREEKAPFDNIADYVKKLREGMEGTKEATEEVIDVYDKLAKASDDDLKRYSQNAWDIWNWGKYGNGQDRVNALGEDYELTQAYVDKMIELGWDEAKMTEYLTEQREKAAKQQARADAVNRLKNTVSKVLTIFTNVRTVLHNITSSIVNILGATFSGLSEAISGKGSGFLDALIFLTGKLSDFTTKIAITKERADKIKPVAKAIGDIVVAIGKGLYTCIKYLIQFIEAAANNKVVKSIFEAIGNAINKIFDGLKKLYTRLKESGVWDNFVDILKTIGTWLGERLVDAINLLGTVVGGIGEGIVTVFEKVVGKLSDMKSEAEKGHGWLSKIKDFFKEDVLNGSWLTKLKDILDSIFGTGKDVFTNAYTKMGDFMRGLAEGIRSLDRTDLDYIIKIFGQIVLTFETAKWLWSMATLNKRVSDGLKNLDKLFGALKTAVKKFGRKTDAEAFESFAKSIAIIIGSFIALMATFAYLESKKFDVHHIAFMAGTIVGIVSVIVGLTVILQALAKKAAYVTAPTANILSHVVIPSMAVTLFAIGYLIKSLVDGVSSLYNLATDSNFDRTTFLSVTSNISLILIILMVFANSVSKLDKTLVGLSGVAMTYLSIGVLVSMLISSFKKLLKIVKNFSPADVEAATKALNWMIIPLLLFGVAVTFITKKVKNDTTTQTNPFKGMTGMLISLAALIRLGFVPLLETIADLRKTASGVSAIEDFKSIVKWTLIFVGLLATVLTAFSNFTYNGRNSGFSTGGNVKGMQAVSLIIASMAAMFFSLSLAIKAMKGVDVSAIRQFKEMILLVTGIVALMSIALTALGTMDLTKGGTGVLLGVASIILGLAAVMAASAWSFKTFTETLIEFANALPDVFKKILEFFKLVQENGDEFVAGVSNTIRMAVIAALMGLVEGINAQIYYVTNGLIESMALAIDGAADGIMKNVPKIKDAIEKLKFAMAYAVGYALFGNDDDSAFGMVNKVAKSAAKDKMAELLKLSLSSIPGIGGVVDSLDFIAGSEVGRVSDDQFEEWKKQATGESTEDAKEKGTEVGEEVTANWYEEYYKARQEAANKTIKEKKKEKEKEEEIGSDIIDNLASSLVKKVNVGKIDFSDVWEAVKTKDVTNLSTEIGLDFTFDDLTNSLTQFNLESEDGFKDYISNLSGTEGDVEGILGDWINAFGDAGTESMDSYSDAIKERMEFVTDITSEAMEASVTEAKKFESEYYDIGEDCATGFANGLTSMPSLVKIMQANKYLAEVSTTAIKGKDALDQRSPSHVFEKIGLFTVLGFANGIINNVSYATAATEEAGTAAILSMRETIRNASLAAIDGIDSPRITPVLDLSNVTDGIDTMNGMFDTTHAYKLAMVASAEAKASNERRATAYYQNGSAYDDTNAIGAINSLNAEVSTLKDAINGMQVVIDGRALVGQIATPMDKALGKRTLAGRRTI
jgi:hypothetical protein